ncbi:hypothetical protein HMPREF3213_02348 [Heyndrickxia coagulans]|uniref:Uncharacterized protein n=1 Tax=Heyndrickxia coagulans TaxID=1398 RepID=A0A133KL55_HEYCO|nr:hypothetical protein HMPREF3213_02348 [Heyndrickxia coagulans]KYC63174.1 hypothetical protein B4100_0334 [Heyndrickxia coagulans]
MIDELFETIIHEQIEEKYISIENQFLDTTKKMKRTRMNIPLYGKRLLLQNLRPN